MAYTQNELIEKLQKFAADYDGDYISMSLISSVEDMPDESAYQRLFPSWTYAKKEAGIDTYSHRYSKEELIKALQEFAEPLDGPLTSIQVDAADHMPSAATYTHRFGDWDSVLETAGLEPRNRYPSLNSNGEFIESDEWFLDKFRELANELGYRPRQRHVNEADNLPHSSTYCRQFGSWTAVIENADLDYSPPRTSIEERGEEILNELSVAYKIEQDVCNNTRPVDAVIFDRQIAIEWDGNYYHTDPQRYPDGPETPQQNDWENDRNKTKALHQEGWHVIRVWGSDIKQRPEAVEAELRRVIKNTEEHTSGTHLFRPDEEDSNILPDEVP